MKRSESWGATDTQREVQGATKSMEAVLGGVEYYDWKAFLEQFFTPGFIKGVRSHRLFRYSLSDQSTIKYKHEIGDPSWETHKVEMVPGLDEDAIQNPGGHGLKPLSDYKVTTLGLCNPKRREELAKFFKPYYDTNNKTKYYDELFEKQDKEGPRFNMGNSS